MNPRAKNPVSSAGGLFQFIDGTAKQYGLADRYDPTQAADAAARLTNDNRNLLRQKLGRDPTPGELYLAHQQGGGGALKILQNPDAPAASLVGTKAVIQNGGNQGMLARDFASLWQAKMDGTKPPVFGGQGGQVLGRLGEPLSSLLHPSTGHLGSRAERVELQLPGLSARLDGLDRPWRPKELHVGVGSLTLLLPALGVEALCPSLQSVGRSSDDLAREADGADVDVGRCSSGEADRFPGDGRERGIGNRNGGRGAHPAGDLLQAALPGPLVDEKDSLLDPFRSGEGRVESWPARPEEVLVPVRHGERDDR